MTIHFAPILEASKLSSSATFGRWITLPWTSCEMASVMSSEASSQRCQCVRWGLWGGQDSGHLPPAIHSGNVHIRQFSTIMSARNQLGGGHHPIILCWILVDNFAPTRYPVKLIASGSGQCSVQWQHSVLLISATRPPRVTQQDQRRRGFVGHTYYQP